jgi:transcription-repair coupling factor (superfamily II helicase)
VIGIKLECRAARIAKLDVGPKGALVTFAEGGFPNVPGLFGYIERLKGTAKLRPDDKLVITRAWGDPKARLHGATQLAKGLAKAAG